MFRQPLWDVISVDSQFLGDFQATNIPVLDVHELAAGKLCALLARQQGRDLFDSHQLLNHNGLEQKRLRLAFVVYGAMNRKDWRTVSLHDIDFAADELSRQALCGVAFHGIRSWVCRGWCIQCIRRSAFGVSAD